MKEKEILNNLKNIEIIEPTNKSFESNLKKRLLNQRQIQLGKDDQNSYKSSTSQSKNPIIFGAPIFLGGMFVFILVIGSVILFSAPTVNQSSDTNEAANIEDNEDINQIQMNINGNVVMAEEFELDGHWMEVRLPTEWEIQNAEYDSSNLEDVKFVAENKSITITSEIYNDLHTEYEQVANISSAEYEVKTFLVDQDNTQDEILGQTDYEYNYVTEIVEANSTIIYSTDTENDLDLLKAIIEDLKIIDPYEGWQTFEFESESLSIKLPSDWIDISDQELGSVSFERDLEDININITIRSIEYDDSLDLDMESYYGNTFSISEESKYLFHDSFGNAYEIEFTSGDSDFTEIILQEDLQNLEIYENEIKKIMSSIVFDYSEYQEIRFDTNNTKFYAPQSLQLIDSSMNTEDGLLEMISLQDQDNNIFELRLYESVDDISSYIDSLNTDESNLKSYESGEFVYILKYNSELSEEEFVSDIINSIKYSND